jgi:hypothetical protein
VFLSGIARGVSASVTDDANVFEIPIGCRLFGLSVAVELVGGLTSYRLKTGNDASAGTQLLSADGGVLAADTGIVLGDNAASNELTATSASRDLAQGSQIVFGFLSDATVGARNISWVIVLRTDAHMNTNPAFE